MNKSTDLNTALGQLTSIPKKTGEQFLREPAEAMEEIEVQAGAKPATTPLDKKLAKSSGGADIPSKKDTLEIVRKIYKTSDTKVNIPSDQIISKVMEENPNKTPEEIQKLATTRQQLLQQQHMTTYYEPTFIRRKRTQEERPAEKIEKEEKERKQMEALELEKKEKKKEDLLSITRMQGTHEKHPGVAG